MRRELAARPELNQVIAVASFLVDGTHARDATAITAGSLVDVLPPFAGG